MTLGRGVILFGLLFLAALVVTLPMRMALALGLADGNIVSARAVSGSVWDSEWESAFVGNVPLGDMRAHLNVVSLFQGEARLRMEGPSSEWTLVRGRRRGIETAHATIDAGILNLAALPAGVVVLDGVTLVFSGDACVAAQGRVATDMVRIAWGGPELAGDMLCDGDAALILLAGEDSGMPVEARLRLASDGRYEMQTYIANAAPALREILRNSGFSEDGERLMHFDEGQLGL